MNKLWGRLQFRSFCPKSKKEYLPNPEQILETLTTNKHFQFICPSTNLRAHIDILVVCSSQSKWSSMTFPSFSILTVLLHWCREKFLLPVHIFSTQYDFLAVKYASLFQQMSSLHPYLKTTAGALLTQCIVSARHIEHFASRCKIVFRMSWKRKSDFLLQGFFSLAQYWGPRAMLVISRERSWWW